MSLLIIYWQKRLQTNGEVCHNVGVANLTPTEVISLFPSAIPRLYKAGQIVAYQGDQPTQIMYVKTGALKYYDIEDNGTEKILQIIGEQSFFSMSYAFGQTNELAAFYSTLTDTEVFLIPLDEFLERLKNDGELATVILGWFVEEVEFILQRIKGMGKNEARNKVIDALDYLASRHALPRRAGWARVKFPFSQQSIAELIGVTRETVSTVFKDIESQKIVRSPKLMVLEVHMERLRKCR